MGAAEARALWQRRARNRCFVCHQRHQQHSSSSSSSSLGEKSGFFSSGDFSVDDNNTKWWLKGTRTNGGFDEEVIRKSMFQDTKCKKLEEFVDLTEQEGEEEEDEEYCNGFTSKNAEAMTPWWTTMKDKDELAFLVATKSLEVNIQNCDLPPPQKLRCTSNGGKGFKAVKSPWKQGARIERSSSSPMSSSPRSDELSKSELLQALRHSQTRAREAEEAAREACAEKERVITILLRQASQMLAYKHWLKLLELEGFRLQEEEEDEIKGVNLKKRKEQRKKKKMGNEIGKYMMAFALGFSLIGAGLFLGWTVGWFITL